jgi:hypothetical protein
MRLIQLVPEPTIHELSKAVTPLRVGRFRQQGLEDTGTDSSNYSSANEREFAEFYFEVQMGIISGSGGMTHREQHVAIASDN